jgi:hypothetical protein
MTTRNTPKTLSEQLKSIKPQVRTVPKVEVRRVFGGYEYDVQYVKPTWEALSKRERAQFLDLFVL